MALADEEHAAPSGRGGRHGHHLTARGEISRAKNGTRRRHSLSVRPEMMPAKRYPVTPAKAGVQGDRKGLAALDSRFRVCEEIVKMNPASLISSFPRKRESRDFSRLPWAPDFAGATIWQPVPILSQALSRE